MIPSVHPSRSWLYSGISPIHDYVCELPDFESSSSSSCFIYIIFPFYIPILYICNICVYIHIHIYIHVHIYLYIHLLYTYTLYIYILYDIPLWSHRWIFPPSHGFRRRETDGRIGSSLPWAGGWAPWHSNRVTRWYQPCNRKRLMGGTYHYFRPIFWGLISGNIPRKYGQKYGKYGTNVPPF